MFAEAAPDHQGSWRFVASHYPYIQLHVVNDQGEACGGLLVDGENWPHRAIGVTVTDPSFHRHAREREIPKHVDKDGRSHIYEWGQSGKIWFCLSGTDEFHSNYSAIAAWEWFRDLDTSKPVRVVTDCVRMIDQSKLVPLPLLEPEPPEDVAPAPVAPPSPPRQIPGSRQRRAR
jgi:hypothetical protein